jgi:hypothetical protein
MTNDEITDSKWQSQTEMLNEWSESNPEMAAPFMGSVSNILVMGANNPQDRKNLWQSITAILRCLGDNSPVKRGRKSEIPASVTAAISGVCDPIQEALLVLFAVPHYGSVTLQRGGRAFFANAEDYAEREAGLIAGRMEDYYRNYEAENTDTSKPSWSGKTGKNGSVTITLGVKQEQTSEEDSE